MTVPANRNWEAWIDLQPGLGPGPTLHVTGEVETNMGNRVPRLAEAVPQGINPAILLLDLTIATEGPIGTAAVAFRPVRFVKSARKGQYAQVQILFEGEEVVTIEVGEVQ